MFVDLNIWVLSQTMPNTKAKKADTVDPKAHASADEWREFFGSPRSTIQRMIAQWKTKKAIRKFVRERLEGRDIFVDSIPAF